MSRGSNEKCGIVRTLFTIAGFLFILLIWWILSETLFKRFGIIPSPIQTFKIIFSEMAKPVFSKAINATLGRSILSFFIAFAGACIFAMLSVRFESLKHFLRPIVTLFRIMPTMALILILLLVVGSKILPIAIAFLVVFPLTYENMRQALSCIDVNLLKMARVFNVSKIRQVFDIYIPAILPYLFACIISGFGLNIKVVIAAEIMGLPTESIGYFIL
ncbi:MAG: ABC transporter permease subunit, partial [Christensenellaceae bacterium]|nr:ABC transporter permease subunit [Christensenellaceae bacterium]